MQLIFSYLDNSKADLLKRIARPLPLHLPPGVTLSFEHKIVSVLNPRFHVDSADTCLCKITMAENRNNMLLALFFIQLVVQ